MNKVSLIEESIRKGLGKLSRDGALVVETGQHTGRAANLRYIVKRPECEASINWGKTNQPVAQDSAEEIFQRLEEYFQKQDRIFTADGYVGCYKIEIQSLSPWHVVFFKNMFRSTPMKGILENDSTIRVFHLPHGKVSDLGIKLENETAILLDPVGLRIAVIGTAYAGEIKKGAFTLCNYLLPEHGIFPMHASANCKEDGSNSSVLFGLSGTGKTTLSATPDRALIGDDEIIWTKNGICNLEGGCYAKLINLSQEKEPDIYQASNRFGSILENVVMDDVHCEVNYDDGTKTENTRGSYSIQSLGNTYDQNKLASHPKTIVFLTADAFGAMPAVARLDEWQAQYHFLSGYTAKVAGTEIGVKEPQAAFSACFGAPFMPRHPSVYGKMLAERMKEHQASVWLLNTGWTGGGYGKGPRFPIEVSRRLLTAIQSGALNQAKFIKHPVFGFEVPTRVEGVDSQYLRLPEGPQVKELAEKFRANMKSLGDEVPADVIEKGGPVA